MAITDYPKGLPLPLRDGYAFKPVNNISRTDMQSGRARQRVEFENVPDMLNLRWTLTEIESRLFGAWARSVVGAGWFKMTILTPEGFDEVDMRFTERVDGPALIGKFHWNWSATVEIRNMPQLEDDWILLPDYLLNPDIFDLAMNREWPLNEWQIYIEAADLAINQDWPTP
jgi:hypothetical protein